MNLHQEIDDLLNECRGNRPLHLAGLTRTLMDGFAVVLDAATTARNAQKAVVKARKAGAATHTLQDDAIDAERVLDGLLKKWSAEMSRSEDTQTTLFS